MRRAAAVLVILLLAACGKKDSTKTQPRGRTSPVCATQDCTSKQIIDNGCSDDGKCLSCVNLCPSDIPSASP